MIEIKSPNTCNLYTTTPSVFMAGSIEMGTAENWQNQVVAALSDYEVILLNPRCDEWDVDCVQSIGNPKFNRQVNWELDGIDLCDFVIFYFDPNTKSPITLMELGLLAAQRPERVIVCCPEGFWRKGNVEIMCARFGMMLVNTLPDLIRELQWRINGR